MEQQPEIIYSLETMKENRKNVINIFNELKGKFLKGYFTINDLVRDYGYSGESAKFILDTLARNGLLNGKLSPNPNSIQYSFENNKQKQIENISLWLKRSELELQFFKLSIEVIQDEIKNENTNVKLVK